MPTEFSATPVVQKKLISLSILFACLCSTGFTHNAYAETSSEYALVKGDQYDLCHHYMALINRGSKSPVNDQALMVYPFDNIAHKQGFRKIPNWKALNKQDYQELLKHYYIYSQYNAYYAQLNAIKNKEAIKEKYFKASEKEAKSVFADIRHVWRTQINIRFNGEFDTVYRVAYCRKNTLEKYGKRCNSGLFLYDDTLPYDQFITSIITPFNLFGHLFHYKGSLYSIEEGNEQESKDDNPSGFIVCDMAR